MILNHGENLDVSDPIPLEEEESKAANRMGGSSSMQPESFDEPSNASKIEINIMNK